MAGMLINFSDDHEDPTISKYMCQKAIAKCQKAIAKNPSIKEYYNMFIAFGDFFMPILKVKNKFGIDDPNLLFVCV